MRPATLRDVVAAAALSGVDGLRNNGVYVDAEGFDRLLNLLWQLGDQSVPPVGEVRNSADDGLMTTADVGSLLDLTPRTVRKAAGEGSLAGRQDAAGQWWFTREAVDAWRSHDS